MVEESSIFVFYRTDITLLHHDGQVNPLFAARGSGPSEDVSRNHARKLIEGMISRSELPNHRGPVLSRDNFRLGEAIKIENQDFSTPFKQTPVLGLTLPV